MPERTTPPPLDPSDADPAPARSWRLRRRLPLVAALGAGLLVSAAASPAGATDEHHHDGGAPSTTVEPFGTTPDGTAVQRWTLSNGDMRIRVLTYGGIIQPLEAPDEHGHVDNVVLGFPALAGYVDPQVGKPYFGALIGRY